MSKETESIKNEQRKRDEVMLRCLHVMVEEGAPKAKLASSLIISFMRYQDWTEKQRQLIGSICNEYARYCASKQPKKPKKESKYYLYAMSAGDSIKIGYSANVDKRRKTIQTNCSEPVEVVWTYYTGKDRRVAERAERKLHRCCRGHHLRGEWFKSSCMDLVNNYKPSLKSPKRGELGKLRKSHNKFNNRR